MSVHPNAFDDLDPEGLKRVIAHSSDSNARACAWVLLDEMSDLPDLETLEAEIETLRERRERFE